MDLVAPKDPRENMEYRIEILRKGRDDKGFAKAMRQMLGEPDPEMIRWWISTFCWAYHPMDMENMRRPYIVWDFQLEKIIKPEVDHIQRGSDLLVKKTREMGFTWTTLATLCYYFLYSNEPFASLLISRRESLVDNPGNPDSLFWKLDYMIQDQPNWLLPQKEDIFKKRRKLHHYNSVNGAVTDGEATTENMAAGGRRNVIFLDEFSRVQRGLDTKALSATRDATPCRIFGSTSEGRGTEFWNIEQSRKVACVYIHWSEHPDKKEGLYKETRGGDIQKLDDFRGEVELHRGTEKTEGGDTIDKVETVKFPEEYPFDSAVNDPALRNAYRLRSPWFDSQCNQRSSLQEIAQQLEMDDGRAGEGFFDELVLERLKENHGRDPDYVGNIDFDYRADTDSVVLKGGFIEEPVNGIVKVWGDLMNNRLTQATKYVVGCDISRGSGASNSTLVAYNARTKMQVIEVATPNMTPEEFARLSVAICLWIGGVRQPYLNFEVNGPGVLFHKEVIKLRYYSLFKMKRASGEEKYGWHNNRSVRYRAFGDLRSDLARGNVVPVSKDFLTECGEYVIDGTGDLVIGRISDKNTSAREAHGDRVVAHVCARMALEKSGPVIDNEWMPDPPKGSIAWWEQRERRIKSGKERWAPNVR